MGRLPRKRKLRIFAEGRLVYCGAFPSFTRVDEVNRDRLLQMAKDDVHKRPVPVRAEGNTARLKEIIPLEDRQALELHFSVERPGHTHNVTVRPQSFWQIYYQYGDLERAVKYAMLEGDIDVTCDCESWLYSGYKYIATQRQYTYNDRETRAPRINNPNLKGSVCKHIWLVLANLEAFVTPVIQWLENLPIQSDMPQFKVSLSDIAVNEDRRLFELYFTVSGAGRAYHTKVRPYAFWNIYENTGDIPQALEYALFSGEIGIDCDCDQWPYSGWHTFRLNSNDPMCAHAKAVMAEMENFVPEIEEELEGVL